MGNDIARDIHCDVTMGNDVAMCTYHGITMNNDVAIKYNIVIITMTPHMVLKLLMPIFASVYKNLTRLLLTAIEKRAESQASCTTNKNSIM